MSLQNRNILKSLLDVWRPNTLATSQWLSTLGVSRQLAKKYAVSGWIKSVAHGVYIRPSETPIWQGALYTLQSYLKSKIHVGGISSISLQGLAHYARHKENIFLYAHPEVHFPKWLMTYQWDNKLQAVKTGLWQSDEGLIPFDYKDLTIIVSCAERAMLEALYLTPQKLDLMECYEVLESLKTLRPRIMQKLLQECNSIKVKRLFLFMAEKADLPVMKYLDFSQISLGNGSRSLAKKGKYDPKYRLTLPMEFFEHE